MTVGKDVSGLFPDILVNMVSFCFFSILAGWLESCVGRRDEEGKGRRKDEVRAPVSSRRKESARAGPCSSKEDGSELNLKLTGLQRSWLSLRGVAGRM